MEAATERWKAFRLNFDRYAAIMEEKFPLLIVHYLDQSRFDLVLDGLRTNSIPITKLDYNGYGRVTDDHWTRLHQIMATLEQNDTVISLTISCSCIADEGTKPFFSALASSECRIQKLFINLQITEKRAALFKRALAKNKSIRKLHLTSNTAPIMDIFKTNTTITSLKIDHVSMGSNFTRPLKHNRTLETIALVHWSHPNQGSGSARIDLFEALASIGTVKYHKVDLGTGNEEWSMKSLARFTQGNPRLAVLSLEYKSTYSLVNIHADSYLFGQALMGLQSLTSLELSWNGAVSAIRHMKNSTTLKHLRVPQSSVATYDWFAEVVTSMTYVSKWISILHRFLIYLFTSNLQRVHFIDDRPTYVKLETLITEESRVQYWSFSSNLLVPPRGFKVLEQRAVRPCCIELLDTKQSDLLEFSQLTVKNPFLEVKLPQSSSWLNDGDEKLIRPLYYYEAIVAERRPVLLRYKCLYQFLTTIMLVRHEHLFSALPNEVLLIICRYICADKISSERLLRAIALASNRDFMLPQEESHIPKIVRFWIGP